MIGQVGAKVKVYRVTSVILCPELCLHYVKVVIQVFGKIWSEMDTCANLFKYFKCVYRAVPLGSKLEPR
jgi:hypothetical protein